MPLSRKVAFIDLTTGKIDVKPIPLEVRKMFLGGRGLDAYLMLNHIKPGADPLGPDNCAVISGGILCGTLASATSRCHAAGKSPLTGGFGSCNMGGFFTPELAFAGFHHLVIKGQSSKPVYIWIHDDQIEIRDGSNVWGKTVHETQQIIREELGDEEIKFLVIGQAGENLVRYANVMTGLKNSGGRTGIGAVLGSKKCKCIAVRGTKDLKIAYPMQALEFNREFTHLITSTKTNQTMGTIGTPFIWGATNSWGGVRTRNFQLNQMEYSDPVEAEEIDAHCEKTMGPYHMAGCYGCQVHCRAQYKITEGPYAGDYDEGPEYTSQGAFCSEPHIADLNTLLTANHMVNMWGVDNLEIGSLISWAMELYEKGILTSKDTDGLDLRFGSSEALLEMIRRICFREGYLGNLLAEGGRIAAEKIGKDAIKYLIHVKGMSNLHSDERATPALALNIAVSSRGSDHLRGRPAIDLYKLPEPVLRKIYSSPVPYDGPLSSDFRSYEGKPWQVVWHEHCYMGVDCLGICKYHTTFLTATAPNFEDWSKVLYYNTGLELTPKEIWEVAERGYNLERLFNLREGWTKDDDMLVDRYFDEPTPLGSPGVRGRAIDRKKFLEMRDLYWKYRGWDENGVPTQETLKRLGLDKEPSHML